MARLMEVEILILKNAGMSNVGESILMHGEYLREISTMVLDGNLSIARAIYLFANFVK